MFTGRGASLIRRRLLRFWSATLSAVLAITLLQVSPPSRADVPIPTIDLVARYQYEIGDSSPRISLDESQIVDGVSNTPYRLDLQATCGKFGFADPSATGTSDSQSNDWDSQPSHAQFIGTPSYLDSVLSNLILIRPEVPFFEGGTIPQDCSTSIMKAWVQESSASWDSNSAPSDQATYAISTSSPVPEMSKPTLTRYNNGFSLAWPEYTGAAGFTPTGFTLRYRETATQQNGQVDGPWQYINVGDNYTSSVVELPFSPDLQTDDNGTYQTSDLGVSYEAFVAPNVQDCDGGILFGEFEPIDQVSYFGIDPDRAAGLVGSATSTGEPVVSQCFAACTPVESVEFDGANLATIFKFTNTDPCTWTVPSNLTSTTVDAYVVGGGGGGGAAGGGGGGGGGVETSLGLAIDPGTTWTMMAGLGGPGAQDVNSIQGDSGANSVVIHPNTNESGAIVARGGGGGGSKDHLGINSASVISGGDGINTGATQSMSHGGSSSAGSGYVGTNHDLIAGKLYGTGGSGAEGRTFGSSFITDVFGSGGGGGAVCAQIDALNYSGGNSQNNGYGGNCAGNSQPGSRDGQDATTNSGGGGGGGASDFDFGDGAGGDGATGVIYIVQTKAPTARYLPSSCINVSNVCTYWEDTTSDPDLTATITGAPVISETSNPALNGSNLLDSIPVVQGGPGGPGVAFDSITFPATLTPDSGYTLFTVARYNEKDGGQYRRIFDSAVTDLDSDGIPEGINWLSGFWGGKSGIAYHGDSPTSSYEDRNWLTPDETTVHNANWVLSTDQKNLYRSNGTQRSIESYSGGIGPGQLVVNQGSRDERSDFQIADVIAFDYELSESEYLAVEAYLSGEYGICVGSCSPPAFDPATSLIDGDVNQPYSTTIVATSPDSHSLTFAVVDPSNSPLPQGLELDAEEGTITGVPEIGGSYSFTIEVTDTVNGQSASQIFTIFVNDPPPPPGPPVFETGSALLDGEVGIPYFQPVIAISADRNSVSYAVVAGELPAGLTLDAATGEISGTPNVSGPFTFTIEATDTVNLETASQEFAIFVIPLPDGPATTLRDGYTGIYYEVKTIGSGISSSNNDFSVISGDLPDGLSLSPRSGKISGTPRETGEFSFTIRSENYITDEIVRQRFTILISSDPQITPVGCEDYSEASYVPDTFWLDDNGYPIGCDMDGQLSVTPVIEDNDATEDVVESWSQRFDSQVNLDYFNLRNGWKCDDCSIGLQGAVSGEGPPGSVSSTGLPLGFSFNYYGKTYDSVFVNSNGSLTFGAPSTCYDQTLTQIMRCGGTSGTSAIVAYGVDLDNYEMNPDVWGNPQVRHADFFYWGKTFTEDGKQAFVATWINSPGYCDGDETTQYSEFWYQYDTCDYEDFNNDPTGISYEETLSTFQIVIIDQSTSLDGAAGDADVIINYGSMQDSQNGYDSCDISRGDSSGFDQGDEDCDPTSDRYLAVGLGSTQVNAVDSELWDSSVTSLQALDGSGPGTILYNGMDASHVGDTGDYPLSSARQFEGSIPGRFVYEFRANRTPDVAMAPSAPTTSLGSVTENSISVSIAPPDDNGGAPVLTYSIEYRITGETSWTTVPTNVQYSEPSATYVLSNLTPSTSYEIRTVANNGIGDSEPSELASMSTAPEPGVPETPNFVLINPLLADDLGYVTYSWDALDPDPESYSIRYRPTNNDGVGNSKPWVTVEYLSSDYGFALKVGTTPILNPETEYEFQISARNEIGTSAWSDGLTVTTSPVSDRVLEIGDISWTGYGDEIGFASNGAGGNATVYDGALKVFVGTGSRSTAIQIECDQSSISYPGFDVGVEGKQGHFEWETAETRVQGGYTVTCAPQTITLDSGDQVIVSLSRFFFTDSPWTRVMIDVTNLDQSEVSVGVWLESKLQSDSNVGNTTYEVSSSAENPTSPATGDRWGVTGDNKESGMVVAHVFGQPLGDVDLVDSQGQINQDRYDQFLSEFSLTLPGTISTKSNSGRLAWFDGIVRYDAGLSDEELAINYDGAIATAEAAAENFTKVNSQLTDTYPRFVPPTLTNFRMPDQVRVSPGIFHDLKVARISGQNPNLDLSLSFNAGYIGGDIPVTYKVSNAAKQCIDNSLNENLFANDGNIEVDNVFLTIEGSQAELNCFIDGLSFLIPNPPTDADSSGFYGYLITDLTEVDSQRGLSELGTKLIFEGASVDQTLIDVETGNATWRGVGTGINDVETRSNRNAYDEGSLKVYWIPNVNADPLTEGIEIVCPQDSATLLTENSKVKELVCEVDDVVTPDGTLSVGISRDFAKSDPWQQMELTIINNGSGPGSEVEGALAYRLDLGSDENTQIEMTSDGDLNLESADSWFITSDDGERTDPVLLHYVGFETGQKITRGTDANIDKIWVKTPLVVAEGAQVTKRYLEGVIDTPRGQLADSVIVAMRAADDLANNSFGETESDENLNIADVSLSVAVSQNRDLPPLRIIYECRDYARNALGPIVLQKDGKVIGCDAFETNQEEGPGPYDSFNAGLFPGDQSLDENERRDAWSRTFSSVFPNAQPRLGWACDGCIVTREGVVNLSDFVSASESDFEYELPSGLPLGFSINLGQTESDPTLSPTSSSTPSPTPTPSSSPTPTPTPTPNQSDAKYDSIRITPYGAVQVHDSRNPDDNSGHTISAFGNLAMSNGALQGNWEELPEYDFFYWGRTVYQGRLAFVVTWVKIPTVEFQSSSRLDYGVPKPGLEPTSVQLMLVSDSYFDIPDENVDANIEDRPLSNVDLIWNFSEIQSEDAVALYGDADSSNDQLAVFSGTWQFMSQYTSLISDEMTETDAMSDVGLGVSSNSCNTVCVVDGLLSNKLQSPINGRYVLGYRDYFKNQEFSAGAPKGLLAPAAPRAVEVSRNDATVASLSWKAPVPWVLGMVFNVVAEPIYGYRIEYAENGRWESDANVFPALNQPPLLASDLISSPDGGETRYSLAIDELQPGEQYTFRVYAVYTGLDLPEPDTDLMFETEISGVPSMADERHDSALEISPVGLQENPMALDAEAIAGRLAGDLEISNATINGSAYAYGVTANSVATFTGGLDSIGFDEGLVIAPLVDARTFERGSGIAGTDSKSGKLDRFTAPQERAKYENIYTEFNAFMQTQESWVPGDPASYAPVCNSNTNTYRCANGMTVLQFDVTPTADFLKFEYALAGTETGEALYSYPDGFGLFVGGIDQSHSCAVVPQVNGTTLEERFVTSANTLEARLASFVPFDSDLHAATITSTMTCSADVSVNADSQTPVTVTMVIANADDQILSPAVFLKGDSVRFDSTSINVDDIPSGQIFQQYVGKQFTATGTEPDVWSATGLPEDLTLDEDGYLSGEPKVAGVFTFEVTAKTSDDRVLAVQPFTIQIDDIEQGTSVRNIRISLVDNEISWDHPIGAPDGMVYDVYYRAELDQVYELATTLGCLFVGDNGCEQFGDIPVLEFSETSVDLENSYDANSNYEFKIVARWPENASYSETKIMATSWRDVCLGEISCTSTPPGRNKAIWEEISYEIDDAETAQGNEDAFDGALNVYIGEGDVFDAHRVSCDFSTSELIRSDDEQIIGHEIVCSDDFYEDLEIKLSRYFFAEHQWVRTMVEVQNLDPTTPFTGTVWLVSNLGSDDETFYEATSTSAGLSPQTGIVPGETGDTWAVTSDAREDNDPVLIHILGDIKDENYPSLSCSATDASFDPEDPTRNSNGCGNTVTGHEISVSGGATVKKAWFTGLVGYSDPLLFDSAKNRAIAAATEFEAIETPWTGDMSNFQVPSLFYEIPELTCESVGGGRAPEEMSALSVVLLNKQLQVPDGESNQTNLSSSTALATQLCNSAQLSTTIFDGRDGTVDDGAYGTADAWEFGLDGADVLVLPETDFRLLNSDLLDQNGMEYLKEWVSDGGRIVMTGATYYRTELENIIGIPAGTLQVGVWQSGVPVPNSNATDVLGSSLPVANGDLSNNMHKFDESFYDAVNEANVNATSLYGGSTDTSYFSAVTKFEIGRGQASYLSSNFEGEPNVSWNEILLQSVYGTETSTIEINESGKNWNLWRSGVHWTEMNPAASFKLGFIGDSTSLTCMNTPSSPAIRKVSSEGTEIICGKQFVQDGLVDVGVSARLSRFVSISGDWMSSNIYLTNLDEDATYENQLWFGGSQNLSSSMRVEATSLSPNGTTNLTGDWNNDVGSSNWIVASEGAGINNVHGDSPSEVVTHVFEPRPNGNHGGADRASWLRGDADEIQSDWWVYLESNQSISISALTGRMSYEPGCDRTAVEISKEFARTITETESLVEPPSLRTDCESLSIAPSNVSAQNSGTNVSVSWSPLQTATHYELSYRVGSSGEWTSPTSIPATADTTMSTLISDLSRSTDYEFRIRAKRLNYGTHGDNAIGSWAENVATLRTSAAPTATPTPTPTPTPTQSATPTPTPPVTPPVTSEVPTPQVPSQVVPQKIAQKAPKFPARLTKGKTAKFTMKAPSGLPLKVSSVGKCKTTKVTKTANVKVLVGKKKVTKKVKVQTGWVVTATTKGVCTVKFANPGDATRNPLAATGKINVN